MARHCQHQRAHGATPASRPTSRPPAPAPRPAQPPRSHMSSPPARCRGGGFTAAAPPQPQHHAGVTSPGHRPQLQLAMSGHSRRTRHLAPPTRRAQATPMQCRPSDPTARRPDPLTAGPDPRCRRPGAPPGHSHQAPSRTGTGGPRRRLPRRPPDFRRPAQATAREGRGGGWVWVGGTREPPGRLGGSDAGGEDAAAVLCSAT